MPIYEFECTNNECGVVQEEILLLKDCDIKSVICKSCGSNSEKIPSRTNWPSHGKPTVVFKNPKTGETEVAIYEHQKAPDGFVKEELKTPYERTKFEKEQNAKRRIEDEIETEERRERVYQTRKNRHSDLNSRMSDLAAKSENPSLTEDLLKTAMNRTKKKEVRAKKTELKLDINHYDKSNLMNRG